MSFLSKTATAFLAAACLAAPAAAELNLRLQVELENKGQYFGKSFRETCKATLEVVEIGPRILTAIEATNCKFMGGATGADGSKPALVALKSKREQRTKCQWRGRTETCDDGTRYRMGSSDRRNSTQVGRMITAQVSPALDLSSRFTTYETYLTGFKRSFRSQQDAVLRVSYDGAQSCKIRELKVTNRIALQTSPPGATPVYSKARRGTGRLDMRLKRALGCKVISR